MSVCLPVCLFISPSVRSSVYMCVCVCLSVCLSISPSFRSAVYTCLSVCLSVCFSSYPFYNVCMCVCLSVCLLISPPVLFSICPCVCLFVCLSISYYVCLYASTIHLSVHLSVCSSVYLSVRLCVHVLRLNYLSVSVSFPVCVSLPLTGSYIHTCLNREVHTHTHTLPVDSQITTVPVPKVPLSLHLGGMLFDL